MLGHTVVKLSTFPCSFNSKGSQDKKKQPSLVKLYSISKIAFYPHFPLQSQCIPAHLWLLEYLALLDIQTEAIRGRKTLTFWGKSGGKMQFCLSLITFPKKIAIYSLHTETIPRKLINVADQIRAWWTNFFCHYWHEVVLTNTARL